MKTTKRGKLLMLACAALVAVLACLALRIFVAIIRIIQIIPSKWSVCSWVKKM